MLTRCVGGPLHNQFRDAEDRDVMAYGEYPPVEVAYSTAMASDKYQPCITVHQYYRHTYVTEYGTKWYQYIHEQTKHTHPSCYQEKFPVFKLDTRMLEAIARYYRRTLFPQK